MLAWGLIGLFAGIFAKPLKKSPLLLYIYGMLSGVAYSMLLDIWTTVWTYKEFTLREYAAAISTAVPLTCLYAVSNLLFLIVLRKPIGDKLSRIKKKYGL